MESVINTGLYVTYALLVAATLSAIVLPIVKLFRIAPRELIKLGIGLASVLVCFSVSYGIASDDGHICNCSKLVSSLIIMVYIVLVLNFVSILYLSISKHFK